MDKFLEIATKNLYDDKPLRRTDQSNEDQPVITQWVSDRMKEDLYFQQYFQQLVNKNGYYTPALAMISYSDKFSDEDKEVIKKYTTGVNEAWKYKIKVDAHGEIEKKQSSDEGNRDAGARAM